MVAREVDSVVDEAAKETFFEDRYWKLYDWLLKRCSTGRCEEYKEIFPNAAHNIIGPFILKETVCEGYSKAFKYLCDMLNEKIQEQQRHECIVFAEYRKSSSGHNTGHAWNIIIKNGTEMLHCDLAYEPDDEKQHGRYFLILEEELYSKRNYDKMNAEYEK